MGKGRVGRGEMGGRERGTSGSECVGGGGDRKDVSLCPGTTDVQTASALFFETFIFLNCTFGAGSLARGCVFILQLEGEEGEVGRERFWLERQNGSSVASTQCNRTENSR